MRLRLYHHRDGARVAYRETGAGPRLVLLHSLGLSYREWEPIVSSVARRFRVVLPDLPLHGDSEDRPRHPYTMDWFVDVMAGFCAEVVGPRAQLAGHDMGAELALRIALDPRLRASRLVLMSNRMHTSDQFPVRRTLWRTACKAAAAPGLDRLLSRLAPLVFRPSLGQRISVQGNPEARDLIRHAFSDVPGNGNRARSWAKFARRWPTGPCRELLEVYPELSLPVLLLWAEQDRAHPLPAAQEALELLPDAQLRTLPAAGFLVAYDDPVSLARELIAFCG
jgi:pimeloyl-ACP methyl ester carboxylesterase